MLLWKMTVDCFGYEDWTKYPELCLRKLRHNQNIIIKPYIKDGYKITMILRKYFFFFFSDLKILKWPCFFQEGMDDMDTRVSLFFLRKAHTRMAQP